MKTKKTYVIMMVLLLAVGMLAGCGGKAGSDSGAAGSSASEETAGNADVDRECLYQVSLLQDLTQGDYYGSVTLGELKEKGDTGLGTFDKLNGEMIVLDGKIYRVDGEGKVEEVPDDETTPFASVTFFDEDDKAQLTDVKDLTDLVSKLDEKYTRDSEAKNYFQVVKLTGTFEKMNVRSELAQEEPYKIMTEVMETDQRFFDYENVAGTVVGVYCPVYMDKLNSAGWHFHFLSDDFTKGGHIVDLSMKEGEVQWDKTSGHDMDLPDEKRFSDYDFSIDQSENVKKVEKPKG